MGHGLLRGLPLAQWRLNSGLAERMAAPPGIAVAKSLLAGAAVQPAFKQVMPYEDVDSLIILLAFGNLCSSNEAREYVQHVLSALDAEKVSTLSSDGGTQDPALVADKA